jgi:type VI secretion system protein ImpK
VSPVNDDGGTTFGPRNKTVLRPQPGGASRGAARTEMPAARPATAPPAAADSGGGPLVEDFIARGTNVLVSTAGPLLSLGANLGATVYQADVEGLRRNAIESVKSFEAQARAVGVSAEDLSIAHYIVCTFLDEAVLQTPWGGQHFWAARSLLLHFHQKTDGGRVFFEILERLRLNPDRYLDLIELQYVCLSLGFQGEFGLQPDGRTALAALHDDVYRLIKARRPAPAAELSPHWRGRLEPTVKGFRLIPWWVTAVAALCLILGLLILMRGWLADRAAPVLAALAPRGIESGYQAPPVPQPASRLKQLLAPQESAGQLSIEEFGKRTVITLQAPELFQSGSAQVAPDQAALLSTVGRAIEAVPGRVSVIGHTDDQPVRSFRFADNFELSRARAVAVAQLLKPQITDFSRVQWTGLGATQPRYQPAAAPENRMRNRRVEIIHTAE